jgi:hypothetical protein
MPQATRFIAVVACSVALACPAFAEEELQIGETKQFRMNGGPDLDIYVSERRLTEDTSEFCQWGIQYGTKLERKCEVGPYQKPK